MSKFLDEVGLKHFYNIIKSKFIQQGTIDKELSTANLYINSTTTNTVVNIPTTKRLVIVNASKNESLSIQTLENGCELHIIINNSSASKITISIPQNSPYFPLNGDVLNINPSSIGEINIISTGNKYYIRIS